MLWHVLALFTLHLTLPYKTELYVLARGTASLRFGRRGCFFEYGGGLFISRRCRFLLNRRRGRLFERVENAAGPGVRASQNAQDQTGAEKARGTNRRHLGQSILGAVRRGQSAATPANAKSTAFRTLKQDQANNGQG